jgi:hypothetical protein
LLWAIGRPEEGEFRGRKIEPDPEWLYRRLDRGGAALAYARFPARTASVDSLVDAIGISGQESRDRSLRPPKAPPMTNFRLADRPDTICPAPWKLGDCAAYMYSLR